MAIFRQLSLGAVAPDLRPLNGAADGGGSNRKCSRALVLTSLLFLMFKFSANHLLLLSRMEYRTCAVVLMQDDSTRLQRRPHN
jgi:hypothetical protein